MIAGGFPLLFSKVSFAFDAASMEDLSAVVVQTDISRDEGVQHAKRKRRQIILIGRLIKYKKPAYRLVGLNVFKVR